MHASYSQHISFSVVSFDLHHDSQLNASSEHKSSVNMRELESPRMSAAAVMLTLLTCVLWAGNAVAAKYSVDTIPPITVSGIRFSMAVVVMFIWCRFEKCSLSISREQLPLIIIGGLLLFSQIALFTIGVAESNSSHTSLLINTFIFWVVLSDHYVSRIHRLSASRLIGIGLAAGGAILVILTKPESAGETPSVDEATMLGDILLMASGFVLAVKILFTKYALNKMETGSFMAWHELVGVVFFFIVAALTEDVNPDQFTTPAVLGLVYQGVLVAGACFAIQAVLLKTYAASQISMFSFLTPVFGIAFTAMFRNDEMSSWLFVSLAMIASGLFFTNRD